jgi:hypothetical protein
MFLPNLVGVSCKGQRQQVVFIGGVEYGDMFAMFCCHQVQFTSYPPQYGLTGITQAPEGLKEERE